MKKSSQRKIGGSAGADKAIAAIGRYSDKRIAKIRENLEYSRKYFAIEGIHDLRVEIKKIRALWRLESVFENHFDATEYLQAIKPLFRRAGKLRDIDIQQAMITDFLSQGDLSEYYNKLKSRELRQRRKFVEACKEFRVSALTQSARALEKSLRQISADNYRDRLASAIIGRIEGIAEMINRKRLSNDDLHEIRRRAKALRYALDLWAECFGKSRSVEKAISSCKITFDALGEMRDAQITLEAISQFVHKPPALELYDAKAYSRFVKIKQKAVRDYRAQYQRATKPLMADLGRLVSWLKNPQ